MKKLFVALLLVLLAQPLPAQAQEVEPSNVWLPLVSNQEALNTPVGGCIFRTVDTGTGDWYVYLLATKDREGNTLVTYWNESKGLNKVSMPFIAGEQRYMTLMSRITNDNVYAGVEAANGDFQAHCVLVVRPSVSAASIPNPVADPPAVPGLILWTWVNWKIDKETHEGFSLSCQAWADKLWVYALILNQDTGKTTERLVHRDETCCLIHEVSCSQSEALVVYEPELLMSVRFETDIDTAVTVERKDFRWLAWLPFIESN